MILRTQHGIMTQAMAGRVRDRLLSVVVDVGQHE
jgi:hypothetical protein